MLLGSVSIYKTSDNIRKWDISPPVKYFYWPFQGWYFFCRSFMLFMSCVFSCFRVCSLLHCGHMLGKDWPLGSCLWCLIVFVSLSHVVSCVRCGTWLYWFLIFATFLTYTDVVQQSACLAMIAYGNDFFFNWATVVQASSSMTILTWNVHQWVGVWCFSLAGPTLAQIDGFFSLYCLWVKGPFLCFIMVCKFDLIVSLWW